MTLLEEGEYDFVRCPKTGCEVLECAIDDTWSAESSLHVLATCAGFSEMLWEVEVELLKMFGVIKAVRAVESLDHMFMLGLWTTKGYYMLLNIGPTHPNFAWDSRSFKQYIRHRIYIVHVEKHGVIAHEKWKRFAQLLMNLFIEHEKLFH